MLEPLHCALHDVVHEPLHVFWLRHCSEALAPAPPSAPLPPHWQLAAAWHVQAVPLQTQAGPGHCETATLPHATNNAITITAALPLTIRSLPFDVTSWTTRPGAGAASA